MKIKFCLITFLVLSLNSLLFAQGGWNIGYLKIGDITKNDVGKIFRIDFKSEKFKENGKSVRDYLIKKDSNFLSIDNNQIEFVEERKIHVDAGYYEDQFLVCKKCKVPLKILDMLLSKIKEETLIFVVNFEMDINDQSDKINFKKEVEVHKNELDGLIFLNSKF